MDLVEIFKAIGIPAILSSIIPFLVMRYYNRKDEDEDMQEDDHKKIEDLAEQCELNERQRKEDLRIVNEELYSINKTLDILTKSEQAILRDKIIHSYNHYKDKKYMPIYARESLNYMYQEYHNLGGNGVIEDLIKKLYQLPTESEDDDEVK